jgi:hypothetical protein
MFLRNVGIYPQVHTALQPRRPALVVVLAGLVVSVLVIGPKVRGFIPGRVRWIFKDDKNSQNVFFRRESKAVGPMS